MNQRFPQNDSPSSIEGTAAHWVGWEMLAERPVSEGQQTPAGSIVTGEMLDGAELLCETIEARMKGMDLHIEETAIIPLGGMDTFGTPDVWAFDLSSLHLEIIDYKFGHRFVDEYFNVQGILYLVGIIERIKYRLIGSLEHISVSFTIVQPRCYHQERPVRTHNFLVKEIGQSVEKLRLAAVVATTPNPTATTNRACGDCPGRHACSALQEGSYAAAEYASNSQPHDLTANAASLELHYLTRAKEILDARVNGLEELTLANLKAGKRVAFHRLGEVRGRQQWNIPIEQVITIGQMFGKDLAKPGTITPAQARKLGMDEIIVAANSSTPAGSLKLLAENPSDARKVFGNSGEV